jgi:hypothetical protein
MNLKAQQYRLFRSGIKGFVWGGTLEVATSGEYCVRFEISWN